MSKVLVTGGGLVGLLVAMFLNKRGNEVAVFERHPDIREVGIQSNRSINLTLCERGLRALACIGLDREIYELAIPVYGRLIHSPEGELTYSPETESLLKGWLVKAREEALLSGTGQLWKSASVPRQSFPWD